MHIKITQIGEIILNIKNKVIEYLEKCEDNVPIFKDNIKEYVLKNINCKDEQLISNNINVIVHRLIKENKIKAKYRGIYFKSTQNMFGESTICNNDLIKRKFLVNKEGNIIGYIVGAKLFNMIGLTTQVPNIIDIVTNKCKYHKIHYNDLRLNIYPPKIEINDENHLFLQLLDIIENKDNINIEVNNYDETIFKIIDENKLNFEKLIKYARITNNKKALKFLIEKAR